ncbi:hypothetical protein THRCLA_22942, partial [Thraustotheca clavata]
TGLIIGCVVGGFAVIGGTYYRGEYTGNGTANGTITETQGSEYSEMGLIVEELRVHKLDLADLKVTAKKPLASGAFGEVWLGTYLEEKVAIKRIKDRCIESVKKFIEEMNHVVRVEKDDAIPFAAKSRLWERFYWQVLK